MSALLPGFFFHSCLFTFVILELNLFVSGWICESLTVDVHPGEDITLFCSNISPSPTQTDWFRVVHGTKPSCISSMYGAEGEPSYCDGFHREKFIMSSNKTVFFLQIKQVDLMDSGLYFCGFYVKKHTVIGRATELTIKAEQLMDLMPGILGSLIALLFVAVVVLAVKNRRLERGTNVDPDDLNYAALSFQAKAKKSHRSGPQRDLEPHVVYAATR
uniref:Immunoglobulin domain-containing protein n=1 Tax=Xiphophorus couchianus TaxID=32473 RepID=A0A3B5LDY1_9TELE